MKIHARLGLLGLLVLSSSVPALAQGSVLNRAKRVAPNHEPAIPRPDQDGAVAKKLEALGVEAENDLQYLTKDEIDGLELKPVTARKLRAAIVTATHYAG